MPSTAFSVVLAILVPAIIYSAFALQRSTTHRERGNRTLLISLGSGGHTTEMLQMLKTINLAQFSRRIYYISSDDSLSLQKAKLLEETQLTPGSHEFRVVKRARKVKQRWSTTPTTTLLSFLDSMRLIYEDRPDLMLCNGPGTCVMLVLACLVLRVSSTADFDIRLADRKQYTRLKNCRIIFIESFARVNSLSLSGKILIHLVDRFLVMWPELTQLHPRAEYAGMLI